MLFRSRLVHIYSRAQIALNETLLELPSLRPPELKPMPELLDRAELETLEIPPGAAVIGRKLREIPLRTQTGASIVAIERAGPAADQSRPGRDAPARRPGPAPRREGAAARREGAAPAADGDIKSLSS